MEKTVRIVTGSEDKFPCGFWITDEAGEPIPKLQGARVELMVGKETVAHLQVIAPEIDVTATVGSVTEVCPHCGAAKLKLMVGKEQT